MIIHTPGFQPQYIDEEAPKATDSSPFPSVAQAMALADQRQMLSFTRTAHEPTPLKVNLRLDGPTMEQWTEAGYLPEAYPPEGYAELPSPALEAYKALQATLSGPTGSLGDGVDALVQPSPHSVNETPQV